MATYDVDRLVQELKRDEGVRLRMYRDSVGKFTIGVGHNLDDRGISMAAAELILADDLAVAEKDLDVSLPWWRGMNPVRQRVLLNMAFNMGIAKLLTFVHTLHLMETARYAEASETMLDSLWARQVGPRAVRLSLMMRSGSEPV